MFYFDVIIPIFCIQSLDKFSFSSILLNVADCHLPIRSYIIYRDKSASIENKIIEFNWKTKSSKSYYVLFQAVNQILKTFRFNLIWFRIYSKTD